MRPRSQGVVGCRPGRPGLRRVARSFRARWPRAGYWRDGRRRSVVGGCHGGAFLSVRCRVPRVGPPAAAGDPARDADLRTRSPRRASSRTDSSALPRRSTRCTSAVAKRRLGPISSATISTLERCSPSSVSQLRCSMPPGHHDAHALGQAQRHVLGQVTPADDVEERRRLLPFLRRPVLPTPVDGHAELGRRLAFLGVADFGFPGEVPGDGGRVAHCLAPYALGFVPCERRRCVVR